jgi:hypothetical protein
MGEALHAGRVERKSWQSAVSSLQRGEYYLLGQAGVMPQASLENGVIL